MNVLKDMLAHELLEAHKKNRNLKTFLKQIELPNWGIWLYIALILCQNLKKKKKNLKLFV